ncbi:MAG TPA: M48 family metallopeptidase [Chthoniobacterales bacterium]
MDFFERQEKAKRHTAFLVVYFTLAVILTVGSVCLIVAAMTGTFDSNKAGKDTLTASDRAMAILVTGFATLGIIGAGSFFKTLSLARGGRAVAELLDGRLVNSNSTDIQERKLLNVVEEMAIASGVPVPQVYVMDDESAINAFAAGHSASDAVISVTHGAMTMLTRDELQGVIAHEFSHLLNGDMKLNIRLMGLIFGILCLTVIGRILLQFRGKSNVVAVAWVFGLTLIITGWIGVLFGRFIQAAVSRQREFLADASAVQFTRNPSGLANALKKIGGLTEGSELGSHRADEVSHFFFANGLKSRFFGFATHPPLIERIRALDPGFDGKYPSVVLPDTPSAAMPPPLPGVSPLVQPPPPPPPPLSTAKPPPLPVVPPPLPVGPTTVAQQAIIADIGQPRTEHLQYAVDLHQAVPPSIQTAVHDPLGAHALVCAFLLADDATARAKQLEELGRATSDAVRQETNRIWPDVQGIPPHARIPLVDLALPALRRLSAAQFEQFRGAVNALIASDNETSLFEFMLQKIVMRHLDTRFYPERRPVTQFYDFRPLARDAGILLSATAYAGADDATQAHAAFARGAESLGRIARAEIPWLPPTECDLIHLDAALDRFAQSVPQIKKNVLTACVETVSFDAVIQPCEAELLRAIADALDCPIPPFLQA